MTGSRSRRLLIGFLAAEGVSLAGTRLAMVALPLLVLVSTGSAAQAGLVAAAELVPMVVLKVAAGPLIDSAGPTRVAVTFDLASAVVVGLVPLLHVTGHLTMPALVTLVALLGALRGPGDAAKHAMVPLVVREAGWPIERVTGLYAAVERTASLVGAALAGLLVAALGPAEALVADAASFLISALVLVVATSGTLAAVGRPPSPPTAEGDPDGTDPLPYLARLRVGWRHLRRDRLLLSLAVMVALTNMLDMAWSAVLMPVWSVESGRGAAGLGTLFALWGGCSAVGALMAARCGERLPRRRVYVGAFLVTGLPRFAVLALDAPWVIVLGVFAVGGVASGFLNPILGAVQLERVPPALVGRATALISALAWALMPQGSVLGGLGTDAFGLTAVALGVGLAYLVVTLAPTLDPTFRELDRRVELGATVPSTTTPEAGVRT